MRSPLLLTAIGAQTWMLRDDLQFPNAVGTKWRKLQHLRDALGLVTMGGPYSNHLHAVALFGRMHGLATVGLVRGEHVDVGNPTLAFCQRAGMQLHAVRKADFDQGLQSDAVAALVAKYVQQAQYTWVPMGGDSVGGRAGAATLVAQCIAQLPADQPVQFIVGAGSGTTARGIATALGPLQHCIAVPAAMMHGLDHGPCATAEQVADSARPPLWLPPPLERYAELPAARLRTIETVWAEHGIVLDPIYVSRVMVALRHVRSSDSMVHSVVVHTGGLQGWAGMRTMAVSAGLRIAIDDALHGAFSFPR
ncbi:MAG: pyridoxal-phosphate dependent enzyme [Kofleriaceae bacterium]|nr:pyridoxal-phosphate dependent enzyme [Kofleriaceae bacterium]